MATGSLRENSHGGLNTFSRAFKTATAFRQVSWLCHRFRLATNFTVARPRGIHTRFPILPLMWRKMFILLRMLRHLNANLKRTRQTNVASKVRATYHVNEMEVKDNFGLERW